MLHPIPIPGTVIYHLPCDKHVSIISVILQVFTDILLSSTHLFSRSPFLLLIISFVYIYCPWHCSVWCYGFCTEQMDFISIIFTFPSDKTEHSMLTVACPLLILWHTSLWFAPVYFSNFLNYTKINFNFLRTKYSSDQCSPHTHTEFLLSL
jgi:hypothetical protein